MVLATAPRAGIGVARLSQGESNDVTDRFFFFKERTDTEARLILICCVKLKKLFSRKLTFYLKEYESRENYFQFLYF